MIAIISPAKSLDFENFNSKIRFSDILFKKEVNEILSVLKKKSPKKIAELMSISSKLADLNYERYQMFSDEFNEANSKHALLSFTGEVYRGLDANSLSEEQLKQAQNQLRILSGLYGLLKPLDLIQPYRLEMGTKISINRKSKDLYSYWKDKVTSQLNEDLNNQPLVNLASTEYFKVIDQKKIHSPIVNCVFKDFKNGEYKMIMTYAKHARGLMARYIIQNNLKNIEDLKGFNLEKYSFDEQKSNDNELVFIR